MSKIMVVGSLIVDVAAYTPHFPVVGETALGTKLKFGPGGKGNNQATAASRAGGEVFMVSKTGKDFLQKIMLDHYEGEKMSTKYIYEDESVGTGSALIEIDDNGDNRIVVIKDANDKLTAAEVDNAEEDFKDSDVLIMQLETSEESILEGKKLAQKYGVPIILNPAPFQAIPDGLFDGIDYLTPNETEAEFFTGIPVVDENDAEKAAQKLHAMGVKNVIITLGKRGVYYSGEDGYKVLNGDDDMLVTVKDKYKNICYFSMNDKNAEVYADNIQPKGIEGISCTIHTKDVSFDVDIPVPGLHMVSNAMAATAIALKIGLNADEIKKGIESFVPTKMRMDIVKTDRYTIVNDVYNANPNSTKAGIDVVAPVEGKSCCILGDMLELGDFGPKLHSEVGQYAIEKNIDTLVCIGEISKSMYEGALNLRKENVYYFPTQEEFWEKMGNILEDGMTILIKASRGMHFEKTTERIKEIK